MKKSETLLRERIIPIFHYCLAHKGDLSLYKDWSNREDAFTKLFYAYYSEVFFRILFLLDNSSCVSSNFYKDCESLVDKYQWYNIQKKDLKSSFIPENKSVDYCEVQDAFAPIKDLDDVIWQNTRFSDGRAANGRPICFAKDGLIWTFADVRGCIFRELGLTNY